MVFLVKPFFLIPGIRLFHGEEVGSDPRELEKVPSGIKGEAS